MNTADQFKLPRFVVINKMNRDNANFSAALETVREISPIRLVPIQLPWGEKADFKGVLDLLTMKAYEGGGKTRSRISRLILDQVETARMELIEAAAEGEDSLLGEVFGRGRIKRRRDCARPDKCVRMLAFAFPCLSLQVQRRLDLPACWMRSLN